MSIPLRVLFLEDRPADVELIVRELRRAGFDLDGQRVDNEEDFLANLAPQPDIILSDYMMTMWDGSRALRVLQDRGLDIPFIIISGTIGEETAVECMKQGAADYLLKDRMGRLGQAVSRALADKLQRTEHKRVENEVLKLQSAVEQSSSSVVITDLQGNIEYVNRKFIQMTGYSAEEVTGKNPGILKSGETPAGVYKHMWDTITAGGEWRGEFHNRKKNGDLFWELACISPIKDSDGHTTHFLALKEDVTERKRTEERLAVSEMRYRRLFAAAQDGVLILNAGTGQVVDANPFLLNLLGYSLEDLLGRELWEVGFFQDITASQASFRELQDKGYIRYDDLPLKTRDGRRIQVEFVSNVYWVNDEKVIQCNVRDITERKRSEKLLVEERNLLRTLIDNLPDQIYAKDAEGRFTLNNQSNAHQKGVASADEVIGKTDFDYYPPDIAKRLYADDLAVIQSSQPLIDREEPFVLADGNRGWLLTSKVPLHDAPGNVIGLVGIGRDITEHKRDVEKLRKLNRTLALQSEVNQAIVRVRSIAALFESVCRIAVDRGRFRMAWVGLLDLETTKVSPVGFAGETGDYLETLAIQLNDEVRRSGPTGSALRTGRHVVVNDVEHDLRMAPWRENALRLGYQSSAAFPIGVAGEIRGTINLYADRCDFFDDDEVQLLDELAADVAFAMEYAESEEHRKMAETALQLHVKAVEEMRLFLQTTFDAFPANAVVLDTDGTILNVNLSWIKFADTNKSAAPMHYLGTNYLTVCDTATGLQSEEAALAGDGIRTVINGSREEFDLEYPCRNSSENQWFVMRVTPFPEPAPHRVVVTHINITERKRADQLLYEAHDLLEQRVIERTAQLHEAKQQVEAILYNSPEGILLLTPDLRITQTNPAFDRLFGSLPDEYFNRVVLDLIDQPHEQAVIALVQSVAVEMVSRQTETRARRKSGTVFDAEFSVGYVPNRGLVCTISDITVRKQAEAALKQALVTEKQLGELKMRFVSTASHEFRTPLATILATTETLSVYWQRLSRDQVEQKFTKIKEQVSHLKDIMDDMLLLARMQARRVDFNPVVFDLDQLCRSVIEEFQSRPDIHHQFVYSCSDLVLDAKLDKKLMRQITSNLISNAVKYSRPDQPIKIDLEFVPEAVVLSVSDKGIGIPESDRHLLFEPFHRGSNVGGTSGTGLGLVITKDSVEMHGGTITVESKVGEGTTFIVRIPLAEQS